ncbi:MAG: UDP-3-O-(3-hydroxymyristoyl)glucosamine N-acyltransferase [Bacteroidota bacterium]|jgi:UDP-3-O-[3-hydroxymyristoyl] glucosamine N-acyltransferase
MFTIQEIADKIKGKIAGNAQHIISFPAKIEEAQSENITFLANKKYIDFLATTNAGCIVISENLYKENLQGNFIIVPDAYAAFTNILTLFNSHSNAEISDRAYIHPSAKIGNNVHVYPFVFIGENVQVGDNCIIYPNVTINAHCIIGNNCIIHSGAVVGSDGFGFVPIENGTFHKIPQLGNVIIEDDCEIGANTCIDRATMGSTILKKGVKLDNLIQVAHNVEIGEHTVIAAQTGISGSTKIGHHNMIGGQVGFVGHISVAPYTKINAQSAIASNIKKEGLALSGTPAIDIKQHFKATVVYKNLPELEKEVRQLKTTLEELKMKNKE